MLRQLRGAGTPPARNHRPPDAKLHRRRLPQAQRRAIGSIIQRGYRLPIASGGPNSYVDALGERPRRVPVPVGGRVAGGAPVPSCRSGSTGWSWPGVWREVREGVRPELPGRLHDRHQAGAGKPVDERRQKSSAVKLVCPGPMIPSRWWAPQ